MSGQNTGLRREVRLETPVAAHMGSTENDAVAPRKHVQVPRQHDVVHLWLRQHVRELALDGDEFFIQKKSLSAEAGAVHNDRLRQCGDLADIVELLHHYGSACQAKIPEKRA